MSDIAQLKKRRQATHDDLQRWEKTKADLLKRRDDGEKGLTPKIRDAQKAVDRCEVDWKAAVRAVRQARAQIPDPDKLQINTSLGAPHWGGCRDVIDAIVIPAAAELGHSPGSRKRAASDPLSRSNPGSDHNEANTNADAVDFPTPGADYALRDHIMAALEIDGPIHDYENYYFLVDDTRLRVQPIAEQHGTGPHCHIGMRDA